MSSFYEILELPSGDIVLKRGDEENAGEPLVTIRFSTESLAFLGAGRFEVAKAMIQAGMEAASELAAPSPDEITVALLDEDNITLH
ncbi:MAG: hypothetical protein EOO07_07090 [Chitinophagaceae bacterium]|nr:MAG: hypothetical protein EOO07_07090 [Chitinophagaceae bacterium]